MPWLLPLACAPGDSPADAAGASPVEVGPEVRCEAPTTGFARLEEVAEERGIDLVNVPDDAPRSCNFMPGGLIARDLDADGDVDLGFWNLQGLPFLYRNDGTGHFEALPARSDALAALGRELYAHGAVDLDADGLPEIVAVGEGVAAVAWNLGEMSFSEWEPVYEEHDWPHTCFHGMTAGDVDGDGDLDLVLVGLEAVPYEGALPEVIFPTEGTPTPLLRNEGGILELDRLLTVDGVANLSLLAAFTDRDLDGDLDLLVGSDRPVYLPPTAFYRNDGRDEEGRAILENDAPEVGADLRISAMGLDVADLDADGLPDYCLTDVANVLRCLLSDGTGGYYEAGLALGLALDTDLHGIDDPGTFDPEGGDPGGYLWSGWSVELVDLDADGHLDAAAAGGAPSDYGNVALSEIDPYQPDLVWQGLEDGTFRDVTFEVGFTTEGWAYGLAAADLAGDGYPEIVVNPREGRPEIWDNPCGPDAWAEVEVIGPAGAPGAIGALVTVEAGGLRLLRQVQSVRGLGQSPLRLHFGLGDQERIDRMLVRWPDGEVVEATDLPARRVLRVARPGAYSAP